MKPLIRPTRLFALLSLNLMVAAPSLAEEYPTRALTLVVPFGAGNIADNQGRLIARHLADALKQPVVVENRPGAGGMIGSMQVARAKADGYTLLYGTHGTQAANSALRPDNNFDPAKELRGVHSLFRQSTVLVTNAGTPWRNVAELVAAAKAEPGRITYASSGIGTQTHLAAARFQSATGADFTHVPYNNQSSMADVLGGTVDITFSYAESVVQLIAANSLRPLAINGSSRLEVLPDVPTVGEAGYPDAALEGWSGVFAPAGTPDDIVALLAGHIARATRDPVVMADMAKIGSYPMDLADGEFQTFVEGEVSRWHDIVEQAGASAR